MGQDSCWLCLGLVGEYLVMRHKRTLLPPLPCVFHASRRMWLLFCSLTELTVRGGNSSPPSHQAPIVSVVENGVVKDQAGPSYNNLYIL